tara:strand:+ start:186 stop:302 length:117 start_codon:yes stop_codon:yes gene_type:complete
MTDTGRKMHTAVGEGGEISRIQQRSGKLIDEWKNGVKE